MNRVTKVIGITGAVAAVVWLLRDRIITVGADRDMEPPRFRTGGNRDMDSSSTVPSAAPPIPITDVTGIGPTYADRLREAGFGDAAALAAGDRDEIAAAASVSTDRAQQWIDEAKTRTREQSAFHVS